MRIIFDLDGCIFYPKSKLVKQISQKVVGKNIPWPIIFLGLLITKQEVDKEMVKIINDLLFSEKIAFSARSNKNLVKKFTLKFLKKEGVNIDDLECLGGGPNYVETKVKWAIQKRVDLVIDDDEKVREKALEEGFLAYSPQLFKKLYYIGVIR